MKVNQLEYLVDIVNSGSFLFAAQKNFISEDVIRQSINDLEIEIEFKLFDCYINSKVKLSVEGNQIFPLVKNILMKCQELKIFVNSINNNSYTDHNGMNQVSIL